MTKGRRGEGEEEDEDQLGFVVLINTMFTMFGIIGNVEMKRMSYLLK